jgi:hypothetical protein
MVAVNLTLAACAGQPDAQEIVDEAIAAHGGERYEHSVIEFDFRGKHFVVRRDGGVFAYERSYHDSLGAVREVLDNEGVIREVNGQRVELDEREARRLASTINSVVYFALLPYRLNDPAVQKRYLGRATVKGEPYHKVEVTFAKEGGGQDYEDRFVYWFHRQRKTMDYLAYTFQVNQGGSRFRRAVNSRVVGGIRFADYLNFTADTLRTEIERYDQVFEKGSLRKVSEIVLENVKVQPISP